MNITREQITQAVKKATGDPSVGPVAVVLPAIIDAIDALANPKQAVKQDKEQRIIKAEETRSNEDK
jgi:hypothetical protein